MTEKIAVDNFLSKSKLAVVGVSRNRKKFGNVIYQELKKKDYKVFAVNPNMDSLNKDPCYPNLSSLPELVEGVVIVVPPSETEKVVKDVHSADIKLVWMQQGSESETAIEFCEKNGIEVVYKECILMFAEPAAYIHKFHRWIWKILKKLPK